MLRRLALAAFTLALVAGCTGGGQYPSVQSRQPTTRCLGQPGRGQDYSESRPLFFLLCAESP